MLEEDHISCAYQLTNGDWREAVFWRMEIAAGEVSKVIYYSQDLDMAMAKRMEERQEMSDDYQMIAGLREEYSMIGYIDLGTGDDGKVACYRFNFCYEQNDNSKIVLAIKDISDIVEWAYR